MDGLEVSGDTVAGNAVFSPVGTLYVCASSSTGSKFYDKKTDSIDQFIAAENYEKRKSAIKVKITDESLVMTSYFLDDMQVFDTFTIQKAPHVCEPEYVEGWEPTCILPGQKDYYMCECGTAYEDAAATKSISNLVSYRFIPALTHDYADATCEAAKTCTRCQATTGKALGHKYDAVCDAECNRCNEPRDASEHKDSDNDGSCDRCSAILPVDKKEIPLGLIIGCTVGAAALMAIAAVVVIITVVSKKKKKI
jgi:hypothetical protein